MTYYKLGSAPYERLRYSGEYHAERRWSLPGLQCPTCGNAFVDASEAYPGVDLSPLPEAKLLEKAWLEKDLERFRKLREAVRPFVPPEAPLSPGAGFGPLVGSAQGAFAQLHMLYGDRVIIRREALEQLQGEGLRGLKGHPTGLRFRQKSAPELWELEVEMRGLLHPECLPPGKAEPCVTCGGYDFSLPRQPVLSAASLPEHLDVFRLRNFTSALIVTERFADTVRRLGYEEFSLRELPVR